MNPETSHIDAYLLADRVVGALLDSDAAGVILSIDIGGSLFDVIAKNAARASLHQFISFPSLVRYRSRLPGRNLHDIVDEPALFGRVDGLVQSEGIGEPFEQYGPRFEAFATRSIDSWTSGRKALRLIHFGDPVLTLDQVAGATHSLSKDRPLATFYTAGMDTQALLSRLERAGYRVLNLAAEPAQPGGANTFADFGWIAVPQERYAEALSVVRSPADGGATALSRWQNVAEVNSPARLQRSRSVFGLPANAPPLIRKFTASEIVAEDDCYPLESDSISSWRWLGPRPRTRIALPCALPGIYKVDIVVIANHLQNGLGECRVLVEGREVRKTVVGNDQGTISFAGQLGARDYTGSMAIDVVSPGAVSAVGADPRVLRLNIQAIAVSPWQ